MLYYAILAGNCSSSFPYLANWTAKPHLFGILFTAIRGERWDVTKSPTSTLYPAMNHMNIYEPFKMLATYVSLVKIKCCVQHFQHSRLLGHEINLSVVANCFLQPKNGDKVIQILTFCAFSLHLSSPFSTLALKILQIVVFSQSWKLVFHSWSVKCLCPCLRPAARSAPQIRLDPRVAWRLQHFLLPPDISNISIFNDRILLTESYAHPCQRPGDVFRESHYVVFPTNCFALLCPVEHLE